MPIPTSAERRGTRSLPKTSTRHSSPESLAATPRSRSARRRPSSGRESSIRHTTATTPGVGQPALEPGLLLAHRWPSRKRCPATVLPTGPEWPPDAMPETRSGVGVLVGAPQRLVGRDPQPEPARGRPGAGAAVRGAGAPGGEVVGVPDGRVEGVAVEVVAERRHRQDPRAAGRQRCPPAPGSGNSRPAR